jgi:nucleotide-binding universal stress UspA family protein
LELLVTRRIRRIVVAVKELQGRSAGTLRKAARLARALGAQLELFHAITDPVAVASLMYADQSVRKFETEARVRCLKRLESLAKPLRRNGLEVITHAATFAQAGFDKALRKARLGELAPERRHVLVLPATGAF